VVLCGPRVWPGLALGAFFANLTTAGSVATSCAIATGNTLEALIGAWTMRRFAGGQRAFERPHDILRYVLTTALASTAVSATIGVTSLALAGYAPWDRYVPIWSTWWLGDVVSDLVVAPLLIVWASPARTRGRRIEAAALVAAIWLFGQVVFGAWLPWSAHHYPLSFLGLPPLIWAAFRFGSRGASAGSMLMFAIAIVGTLRGFGPFALHEPNTSLILLQGFTGTMAVAALMMAALVTGHERVATELGDANARLEQDASRQRDAEARIIASLREKDVLLKEIHHRVKNNLQVMSSLLSLQADQLTDPASVRALTDSQHRIRSMALVHEALYGSPNLATVDMQAYLTRLVRPLEQTHATAGRVDVVMDGSGVTLPIDCAGPCGLILNELISNALRHAFADGRRGRVRVRLRRAGDVVTVSVDDDGLGLPVGVTPEHATTLGLRLVAALTEQLNGRLRITREHGTAFTLEFPAIGSAK